MMGKKDFEEKKLTAALMVAMSKPLWGTGKVVVMDSGLCVPEGLISMVGRGDFGLE